MPKKSKQTFQQTLFDIQERFGASALQSSKAAFQTRAISTGYPDLDNATGLGGIPIGHLSGFTGQHTSGRHSLAYTVIASAHRMDEAAVYIDLTRRFDPDFATGCGVDLHKLLLVRLANGRNTLAVMRDLLLTRSVAVMVIDAATSLFRSSQENDWRKLIDGLRGSQCALILLGESPSALPSSTALALQFEHHSWMETDSDIIGFCAEVSITVNKFAPVPRVVRLPMRFNDMQHGDR